MSTSQTEQSLSEAPPVVEPPVRSTGERLTVRMTLVLVALLIVTAVVQTVGPDLLVQWRRLTHVPVVRPVEEPAASWHLNQKEAAIPVDRKLALAADSQISPPKRRVMPTPQDTWVPAVDEPVEASPLDPVVATPPIPDASLQSPSVPVEAPNLTTTLLETAGLIVSRSWQDFAYPASWAAAETSKSRMVYGNHRNRLLKAAVHQHPSALSLELARKDYAAARAQYDEDPRLDYVFGLVLWAHGQSAEAIDMFQTAARLDDDAPFLPAGLAVAWGRFLIHDERRGMEQLHRVARVLAKSDGDYPPSTQREQAAISIGRALGYLSQTGRVPELAETVGLTATAVRNRLPTALQAAYDSGFSDVGQRESELMRIVETPQDQLRDHHKSRTTDLQSKINSLQTEMRDSRNALTRSHRSHVDTIADLLKEATDIRGQIDKVRPAIKKLQESISQLTKPQPHIEKKTMPSHFDLMVGPAGQSYLIQSNATMTLMLNETGTERATRVSKLSKAREDLKKIDEDLSKLRDQQQDLVARRNAEDRQHKADKEDARRQRVARLEEQRELERKLLELNKALRRTMTLREGIDTIAAYIPWNPEVEGEALWQALNPKNRSETGSDSRQTIRLPGKK